MKDSWILLRITGPAHSPTADEAVAACLAAYNTCGIHEVDRADLHEWHVYFERDHFDDTTPDHVNTCLAEFAIPGLSCSRPETVARENWHDAWREYFKPVDISPTMRVVPAWESPETENATGQGRLALVINPGMAFGTGTHETTQLCLRVTEQVIRLDDKVLDVGTGSGILAIAALKLGAQHVVAVDNDPDVEENLHENLALNHITPGRCTIIIGDLATAGQDKFDLILCNMLSHEFLPLIGTLKTMLAEGGRLLLSGFLLTEKGEVEQQVTDAGFSIGKTDHSGEWGAMLVSKT